MNKAEVSRARLTPRETHANGPTSREISVGPEALGALHLARNLFGARSGSDVAMAFAPVRGWWSAMWKMSRMDREERRQLIGCAASRVECRGR